MSDTPRTDGAIFSPSDCVFESEIDGKCVDASFARTIERELNDSNERIKLLIAERDTARQQADRKYQLRREFEQLLGTDDVESGVQVVRGMTERIKRLEKAGDLLAAVIGPPEKQTWSTDDQVNAAWTAWTAAKEAK